MVILSLFTVYLSLFQYSILVCILWILFYFNLILNRCNFFSLHISPYSTSITHLLNSLAQTAGSQQTPSKTPMPVVPGHPTDQVPNCKIKNSTSLLIKNKGLPSQSKCLKNALWGRLHGDGIEVSPAHWHTICRS